MIYCNKLSYCIFKEIFVAWTITTSLGFFYVLNFLIGWVCNCSSIGVDGLGPLNNVVDHPLALSNDSPLQSPNLEYSSDYRGSSSSLNSVQSAMSKSSSFGTMDKSKFTGHGMCLTASDQDRIRIFMHEFAVRALIPWAERQMRTLNDLVWNLLIIVL